MIRQYNTGRHLGRYRIGRRMATLGTIGVGTIVYLQDRLAPGDRPTRRNPWIVRAWLNREYHPATAGRPGTTYTVGGHLAVVQSLRDGRSATVADWMIRAALDIDEARHSYPYTGGTGETIPSPWPPRSPGRKARVKAR